jgi:CheY-like chemotaxis protein
VSKRRLLLADDSVTIQKVVNLTFADEGIDVITVGDGDSAIETIAQMPPDLVLADVHMPGLNGYQICERLRSNPSTADLPVVLLVGSFEPFDEEEAQRVGANGYLTKPFQSIRQLVSQVSDLMESRSAGVKQEPTEAALPDDETFPQAESEASTAFAESEAPTDRVRDTTDIDYLYEKSLSEPAHAESEMLGHDYETLEPAVDEREQDSEEGEVETAFAHSVGVSAQFIDSGMDDDMIEESHPGDVISERRDDIDQVTEEYESLSMNDGGTAVDSADYASDVEPSAASPFDSIATSDEEQVSTEPAEEESEERYFDQFAETERIDSESVPETGEFQLDELELLELPPLESGKTIEFTTTERLFALGGRQQVVSLSPELMDIIVQKVVEKMSEKQ